MRLLWKISLSAIVFQWLSHRRVFPWFLGTQNTELAELICILDWDCLCYLGSRKGVQAIISLEPLTRLSWSWPWMRLFTGFGTTLYFFVMQPIGLYAWHPAISDQENQKNPTGFRNYLFLMAQVLGLDCHCLDCMGLAYRSINSARPFRDGIPMH